MLLGGINHVATLTSDTDRLHAFYRDVFEAEVTADMKEAPEGPGVRLSIVDIGDGTMLNVFQIEGNAEAERQVPMFGRGRIDHIGLHREEPAVVRGDPQPAHRAGGGRRLRDRLRAGALTVLPRS